MDVSVSRSRVRGTARAPPSKSYTHRAILAAGYGSGATLVTDALDSADTRATARAVSAFGGDAEWTGDDCRVEGFGGRPAVPGDVLDCANSGTTMRLTTATAALADGLTVLTGDGSLRSRPQGPLLDAIEQLGGRGESTRANGCAPLVVGGPIAGGRASIPGDVSSQFVTALLMAGAVTDEGIEIELTTELKSAPYVDITVELLDAFGVDAGRTDGDGGGDGGGGVGGFRVAGGQRYATDEYAVPGDFSSLSYLLAAGALAGPDEREEFLVRGVRPSAQGDSAILDVLDRMGADLAWDRSAGEVRVARSSLSGIEYAVADTPDLLPTIAVLGAAADGTTRLTDCEHVRYKETDRVAAMAAELDRLGAAVEEREDELLVHGGDSELRGARVDGHADHRIVMSLAVAGLVAEGTTTVSDAEDVDVSFPGFFDVLERVGGDVRRE